MIGMQFLIRRLIRNADQVHDPAVRNAYGRLSGLVGIVCNLILFAGKLLAGLLSGSVAITADAVNNLSDASSSVISLLGFHMASRPADDEHPFGHGRYEYLSGLMVAVIILLIGLELLKSSVQKVLSPEDVSFSWLIVGVLAASIGVKLWMMLFNRRIGRLIGSQTLIATAADSRNDVISTAAVLAATLVSHLTGLKLDGWMGLLVALFILYSGVGLIHDTLDPLLGKAPDPALVRQIHEEIMAYPGVLGTHDLMIHDYGPGRQFASVHVEMPAEDDVLVSHDVIDNIERDLQARHGIHVVVHFDPIATSSPIANDLRGWISREIQLIDPRLSIHDLRVVTGPTHTNVIFDCAAPHGLAMTDGELRAAISALVKTRDPSYNCVITIDRSFVTLST